MKQKVYEPLKEVDPIEMNKETLSFEEFQKYLKEAPKDHIEFPEEVLEEYWDKLDYPINKK